MLFGGEPAHRLIMGQLSLIEATLGQDQRVGVFVELGLRREFVGGELLGAVVSLLRKRLVGGGPVERGRRDDGRGGLRSSFSSDYSRKLSIDQ